MLRIINRLCGTALCLAVVTLGANAQSNLTAKARNTPTQPISSLTESDRTRDGLVGPVRRVRTEVAKLTNTGNGLQEGKHVTLELAAYDLRGNKTENQYFPMAGSTLTGKEVYKYDEKGNISEMTLLNTDGSLMSKEVYTYEFDFAGNWNKMTTSVAVVEGGRVIFEPTEITYRFIMYYLDENMLKSVQPAAVPSSDPATAAPTNAAAKSSADPKTRSTASQTDSKKANPAVALPAATTGNNKLDPATAIDVRMAPSNSNLVNMDAEPPPSPAPKPILKPVSGGVLNGTAIALPPPVYPDQAKRMRTSGVVSVDVVLDETGKVISASASSGPRILREAAEQAALKARFSPTKLSGQPVKVAGVINYKFELVP